MTFEILLYIFDPFEKRTREQNILLTHEGMNVLQF